MTFLLPFHGSAFDHFEVASCCILHLINTQYNLAQIWIAAPKVLDFTHRGVNVLRFIETASKLSK